MDGDLGQCHRRSLDRRGGHLARGVSDGRTDRDRAAGTNARRDPSAERRAISIPEGAMRRASGGVDAARGSARGSRHEIMASDKF